VGETALPSPRQVETPLPREQEGAPEPPQSRGVGDPITISGGDRLSKDARSMDEEVEASPVAKRTPWPIRLHSFKERRKKEEEEREQEPQQHLQEVQQQLQWGESLEDKLEQCRQQELLELQRQQ